MKPVHDEEGTARKEVSGEARTGQNSRPYTVARLASRGLCAARACLLPFPTLPRDAAFIMGLEDAIAILEVLTPIAKAIPVLGAPVEGSLEAVGKILKFAKVRRVQARTSHCCLILSSRK
jgi:hypothetical protein